jgi:hypothetical protein
MAREAFTLDMPDLVLGVDPGLGGAFALYDPHAQALIAVEDMPTHEIRGKRHLDVYGLAQKIEKWAGRTRFAIIEEVKSAPHQGVASTFKFGFVTGVVTGIIAAHYIPSKTIPPAVWKLALGLPHGKDASRKRASEMFPRQADLFSRSKDDGRAEALLLAVFGSRALQ